VQKIIKYNGLIQYIFLFLLIIFLFVGGPQLFDTRSLRKLWDLGHIVLFALLFTIALRDSKWLNQEKLLVQFGLIFIFTIILGLIIEGIQLLVGRTGEFIDVWRNLVGTLLAFVYSKNISGIKQNLLRSARVIVIIFMLLAAWSLIKAVTDEIQAQIDFPVIADFENPFEIEKWYGQSYITINKERVTQGSNSLKSELLTIKYSGISISYFPTDWHNYSKLKFSVYSESDEPLKLTCRMHDKEHNNSYTDRFNKTFRFDKGWNEISINLEDVINAPISRKMDITEMKNFALFAIELQKRKTIYFDYLRLE